MSPLPLRILLLHSLMKCKKSKGSDMWIVVSPMSFEELALQQLEYTAVVNGVTKTTFHQQHV